MFSRVATVSSRVSSSLKETFTPEFKRGMFKTVGTFVGADLGYGIMEEYLKAHNYKDTPPIKFMIAPTLAGGAVGFVFHRLFCFVGCVALTVNGIESYFENLEKELGLEPSSGMYTYNKGWTFTYNSNDSPAKEDK